MTIPYTRATHADGDTWTAAKANNIEAGVKDAHLMPTAHVSHNAAQAISANTPTRVVFNTESFDQVAGAASNQHDTSSNSGRLTCRYAGVYVVTANVEWSGDPGNGRIMLALNGDTTNWVARHVVVGDYRNMSVTSIQALSVNDYLEVWVHATNALNINSTANHSPRFAWARVG